MNPFLIVDWSLILRSAHIYNYVINISKAYCSGPTGFSVAKDIAIGAGGLGFDCRVGQIGPSVANGSPPLPCFFRAVCPAAKPRR